MAESSTPIDLIVDHKENIQPLPSGRSARALAASLSPLSLNPAAVRSEHSARQSEFEQELKNAAELDDPLDVWVRYVNWTIEAFPSGQSTESGLVPLLERATGAFINEPQYKNDPRYLKLWMHYISNFSDAPREAFAYLHRREIGQRLALFYDEYAALLESMGRRKQAAEIFQSGIENNARPVERLQRKYDEFLKRMELAPPVDDEPSSPALPAVRPALAVRPFGGSSGGLGTSSAPQQQPQPQPKKQPRQKMAIFSDADNPEAVKASSAAKEAAGWQSIGTLEHRKKENKHQPEPWAGQVMKQQGGTAPPGEKLMVFRDPSYREQDTSASQATISRNKRPERVAVNLELIYPEDDAKEEFCFEELQAIRRGLYSIDWNAQREAEKEELRVREEERNRAVLEGSRTPVKVKTVLSPSPNKEKIRRKGQASASPTMTFHTRAATDEIYSLFNQPLKRPTDKIDSNDEDDSEGDSDASDGEDYTTTTQIEPEAESETGDDDDDARSVKSEWSDFTGVPREASEYTESGYEQPVETRELNIGVRQAQEGIQKLAIFKDEPTSQIEESEPLQQRQIQIPPPPDDFDPPILPYHAAKEQAQFQNRLPYMTPIVERTESLPPPTARHVKTPSRTKMTPISDDASPPSSPVEDKTKLPPPPQPDLKALKPRVPLGAKKEQPVQKGPIITDLLCNPFDPALRALIFEKMQPPLKSYPGYYEHKSTSSGKAAEIRKYTKALKRDGEKHTASLPRAPTLEFVTGDGGSSYLVRKELGKGAFAPVYLVENIAIADAEDEAADADADPSNSNDENDDGILALSRKLAARNRLEAIKMEDPPTPWEFYILRQALRRLGPSSRAAASIIRAPEMHLFADECFLVLSYRAQGTILDLINTAKSEAAAGAGAAGGLLDELLVMFLSVELLRTVEALHTAGILHGDLKPDNCLIRFDHTSAATWSARYSRTGADGWADKGIALIDFGRGIDLRAFAPHAQFVADWKTDAQDCAEMREMRPWSYQVDYHGLAATLHSMLFGRYIETVAERADAVALGPAAAGAGAKKRYRLVAAFKRYWQHEIWADVFELLLNPLAHTDGEKGGAMPVTNGLRRCRERMEAWLEANCERGVGLRSMIRRMESLVGARRK